MVKKASRGAEVLRFAIKPVGAARSEKQIRKDVAEALDEAVKEYKSQTSEKVRAEAEPEGAFTGIELARTCQRTATCRRTRREWNGRGAN